MSRQAMQQLLEEGVRSGLLPAAAAQEALAPSTAQPPLTSTDLAERLVKQQVLTAYQARALLDGRGADCRIAGRYVVLDLLGAGGMGAVYKARDTTLDRVVALKVLPPERLGDADAVARFQREAKALARLSHPNIIQAFDSGEDRGRHFLVMEFVDGVALDRILRSHGALPPTVAADFIHQAALGLAHAHARGLIHRDLKPANLLVAGYAAPPAPPPGPAETVEYRPSWPVGRPYAARVKILDLGLARFLQDQLADGQLTQEGMGIGTPDYMAPEQFRDALRADVRTDVYGLGCTLYHLIAGQVPFPGSSHAEKAEAHARKEAVPLEERCPELPGGLACVVARMMAKHPDDRFQTADEVADALAPYVAGGSHSMIRLKQTGVWNRGQPTMRRPVVPRRMLLWTGGSVAAALLALFIAFWPRFGGAGTRVELAPSTAPPGPAAEPERPKVVTIDNGWTVAQDGTGQFRTITEALEQVRPGQTVRVLDAADYVEQLHLSQASRFAGITLEAPRAARLVAPEGKNGLIVMDVPRLTLRGFRFRGGPGGLARIGIVGNCPGTLLDRLTVESGFGILLWGIDGREQDAPLVVRDCDLTATDEQGIRVSGIQNDGRSPRPCRRVLIRDNHIRGARYGLVVAGQAQGLAVVGNRFSGCGAAGIAFNKVLPGMAGVLLANNTLFECRHALALFDDAAKPPPRNAVRVTGNLVLAARGPDFVALDGEDPDSLKGMGDGAALRALWRFSRNWREVEEPAVTHAMARAWVPAAPDDVRKDRIDLLSRDPHAADFLRPAKDSPLATGGAGGDLPAYVGAVPPKGLPAWDWERTWKAREKITPSGTH